MSLISKFFNNGGYNLVQMDWPHIFSLNEVAELILDASKKNYWAISRSGILPSSVAERLRRAGYEVYVNGDTSDPYFSINWSTMLEKE